ncbi:MULTISPECIES: hypothetical protein [Corynebacterium]|uniref:hypothetical protein n=1 Tax=Corynebacterium TaxID=1716 RepID=UPI00124DD396|nr:MULTISPECIES: hypothetical protein [Corynebacterium]
MSKKAQFTVVSGIALLVVVLVVVVVATTRGGKDDSNQVQETTATASSETEAARQDEVTSDIWGRQVITNGETGQPLGELKPVEDRCTIQPDVMIQTSYGGQAMWSNGNGPARIENGIPVGYANNVTGAALAGWNYRMLMFGDYELGAAAAEHVDFSGGSEWEGLGEEVRDTSTEGWDLFFDALVPEAVRVLSCKDNFAVVEMAHKMAGDEHGKLEEPRWDIHRFTMLWRDGDWVYQASSLEHIGEQISDIDGWDKWRY